MREGGSVVCVVVDYCVVCGMGSRVDDQKWELVPVLITKNRLFESRGGLYKNIQVDKNRQAKFIQAILGDQVGTKPDEVKRTK